MSLRSGSLFSTPKLLAVGALAWLAIVTASGRQRPAPAARGGLDARRPCGAGGRAGAWTRTNGTSAIRYPGTRLARHLHAHLSGRRTEDRITTVAAGITFFGLLALFPAVTALVSLYGLFADPATVRDHLFALSFMLPGGAFQIVEDQISRIIAQGSGELTFKLVLGSRDRAVGRKCRDEGDHRRPECRV
jgi:membrane protein